MVQLLVAFFALGTFVNYHELDPASWPCTLGVWLPLAPFFKPLLPAMWYVLFIALSNGKAPLLRSVDDNAWTNTMLSMVMVLLASWFLVSFVMLGPLLLIVSSQMLFFCGLTLVF